MKMTKKALKKMFLLEDEKVLSIDINNEFGIVEITVQITVDNNAHLYRNYVLTKHEIDDATLNDCDLYEVECSYTIFGVEKNFSTTLLFEK